MNRPVPPPPFAFTFSPPPRAGLAVLVAISALQPFALNVLAPSTPGLARAFQTDYATIQLTLGLYLFVVAIVQLAVGPIADQVGRRPCVVFGIALFTLGSLLGALAQSTEMLIFARMLQAAGGGTAFALARAVVRDQSTRDEAASKLGYLTMVMVLSPMVAPLIGGMLDARFGWRGSFVLMVLMGMGALWFAAARLPETLKPHAEGGVAGTYLAGFGTLLRSRSFIAYVLTLSFTSVTFFVFIAGAPYIVVETMGATADVYGLYFVLTAGGYMIGNFISGRFGQRIGAHRLITWGCAVSLLSVLAEALIASLWMWTPATLFIPLIANSVGSGLTLPGATASALSVRPDIAGTAAGITGAMQLGLGAAGAILAGALVVIWPFSLIAIMLVAATLSLVIHLGGHRATPRT